MKRISQQGKFVYPEKILHRAKVLALVIKKKVTQSQAAKELKLRSNRQIRNLLRKYISGDHSISSLVHTRNGEPWNKIDTVTSSPPARGGASLLCVSLLSCSFWEELKLNTLFRFRLVSHVLLYFIGCYFVSHSSDEISISPEFFAPASSGKAWEFTEDLIS